MKKVTNANRTKEFLTFHLLRMAARSWMMKMRRDRRLQKKEKEGMSKCLTWPWPWLMLSDRQTVFVVEVSLWWKWCAWVVKIPICRKELFVYSILGTYFHLDLTTIALYHVLFKKHQFVAFLFTNLVVS